MPCCSAARYWLVATASAAPAYHVRRISLDLPASTLSTAATDT